jgi:CRISPR/Cas system-associated exonuclease Cas4 (RecB family)
MNLSVKTASKPYLLTKSRVMSGLQCPKKLWFDVHQPIKQDLHIFYIGNRFGEFARTHYGPGVDLTGNLDAASAIEQTQRALSDPLASVIYEAAFLHNDTLVRVDVLIRRPNGWEMIEVKSSTKLKDEHIEDAAVQTYIAQACGIDVLKTHIAHINNSFIYPGNGNYDGLLIEADITEAVKALQPLTSSLIANLKPIALPTANSPEISMGEQCTKPHDCLYQARCSSQIPQLAEVPIAILPYANKKLIEEFAEKNVYDLRDVPASRFTKPQHLVIHQAHTSNSHWISPTIVKQLQTMAWPRYFMDFETVQQGVPIMPGTKSYDALPFQWSVHRWDNPTQVLNVNDGLGYLEFFDAQMDRAFLETLLNAVGTVGPIFVHNASFECSKLRALTERPSCADLSDAVEALIGRIVDTLNVARDGFYAPQMMGSYSLKDIVKAIPTTVDYSSAEGLTGGGEAQIAWFKCTDQNTSPTEKEQWAKKLKHYCAQDTLAMYDFIKYLCES